MITKKLFSKILAWTLTLALMVGVIPFAAQANTDGLKAAITTYTGGTGATGSLTATATDDGDTVTVEGSVTGVSAGLTLEIPAGVIVDWQATLTGMVSENQTPPSILMVSGSGTLNITGGEIANNAANEVAGYAIGVGTSQTPTIRVSGGNVIGKGNAAILGRNAAIYVSGGEITSGQMHAADYGAIHISTSGSVTVSGGTITADGSSPAISGGTNTTINISGTTAVLKSGSGASARLFGNTTVRPTITGSYLWSTNADGSSSQKGSNGQLSTDPFFTTTWGSVRYLEMQPAEISGITVTTDPTLTYTHGDALDLSALRATVTYDDNTEEVGKSYSDLTGLGFTFSVAHNTPLLHNAHNGTTLRWV